MNHVQVTVGQQVFFIPVEKKNQLLTFLTQLQSVSLVNNVPENVRNDNRSVILG